MRVVGDVQNRVAVLVDDIIDTGGTLIKATEALLEAGAEAVYACCTHAVLSGDAKARIEKSSLTKLLVSDSIYHPDLETPSEKITQVSVTSIISEAIGRIHRDESVSSLFSED
jgi:ribose-phosphate pyrophosphokinase